MPDQPVLYSFPQGPDGAQEWEGTPLHGSGATNRITRLKGRTQAHNKTLDDRPEERDAFLSWAEAHVRSLGSQVRSLDVVIHGVRVRSLTNSPHMASFFAANWFSPDDWAARTGVQSPAQPQLLAYALIGVPGRPAGAYYSRQRNTVLFVNTSYYGQLKSWVLGAVGRLLAEERGIHSIHGACVQFQGHGILYVAPTGTGKSTSSYGLMTLPGSRFHSDDWVYARYALPGPGGEPVAPTALLLEDRRLEGAAAIGAILERRPLRGRYEGYRLSGDPVAGDLAEIDPRAPLSAYAYTSEKVFYLRTNLVESFPPAARSLLTAPLENVPDVAPALVAQEHATLQAAAEAVASDPGSSGSELLHDLARLIAFDNARAMLDAEAVFGRERVIWNPMEPVRLTTVFLLERDFAQRRVMAPLDEEQFLWALLQGTTPSGTQETAYNAYRAVDDGAERRVIDRLTEHGRSRDGVYRYLLQQSDVPATLVAEATLFRALHGATRCYVLNTILERDPAVPSRAVAVGLTLQLIVAAALGRAAAPLDLDTYRAALPV